MTNLGYSIDDTPKAKVFREKIGPVEFELLEEKLDVFDDVVLWNGNPRLLPHLAEVGQIQSEEELENHLKQAKGYAALAKSIQDLGQMEPIYVWKRDEQPKYLVIEGATRVTILRDFARREMGKNTDGRNRKVKAKVLPAQFTEEERAILLARIHVRGSGVRSWGRYIEAWFIYEIVVGTDGRRPLMSVSDLARHMGKSPSWVSRLKDAYQFAQKFVDYVDDPEAQHLAVREFSTLEEIAKSRDVGPKLKDYENRHHDGLRADVFDMVRKEVFKEYRDARFMKEFHEDPEKWALLKAGEKHAAHKIANDLKAGSTTLKAKLEMLPRQLERALERDVEAVNEDDLESLRSAVKMAESYVNQGVPKFRLELLEFVRALESASLIDVRSVQRDDIETLEVALSDFRARLEKHKSWA
jgi:hypothetical protein